MKLDTIGKNIRKFREIKKLRQEDLAEKTDLTTNYIGMIERGEKVPSLTTFVLIANAIGISTDILLVGITENSYAVQNSLYNERIGKLDNAKRSMLYSVIDAILNSMG